MYEPQDHLSEGYTSPGVCPEEIWVSLRTLILQSNLCKNGPFTKCVRPKADPSQSILFSPEPKSIIQSIITSVNIYTKCFI